jgi:phosphoribosylformylglycinamidine synthase
VEKRNGDFVRDLIRAGRLTACHDVSDGGLLVALAEMVMAGGVGLRLIGGAAGVPPHAFWFGEDQARYVLSAPSERASGILADARAAGVPALVLGTSVGDALILPDEPPIMLSRLKLRHEGFMPALMSPGKKAA